MTEALNYANEVMHGGGGPRITRVVLTPVAFPDPPLLNAIGAHQPFALRTIIEVHAGDGLLGISETYGDDAHLRLLCEVAPNLVGLDPFDLNRLSWLVARTLRFSGAPAVSGISHDAFPTQTLLRVIASFEVACFDLQGHITGRPVHQLLGGKVRDRVDFSAYLFYKWAGHPDAEPDSWGPALDSDGIVAQARRMVTRYGFKSIKLKGGVLDPEQELETLRALHTAFPGRPLRMDPNAAWSVETAVTFAGAAEGLLEYLEDPTPGIPGMSTVARSTRIPLATNMCVVGFDEVPQAFEQGAVGVVLGDHHYWGGLRQSQRLAGLCETYGVGLSMHSNSHLGISLAAMTHFAAATPALTYACDTHTPWLEGVDVLDGGGLPTIDGAVTVPDTPGLGVSIDRDALAVLHELYQVCGIRARDDTAYRARLEPGYERRTPRW